MKKTVALVLVLAMLVGYCGYAISESGGSGSFLQSMSNGVNAAGQTPTVSPGAEQPLVKEELSQLYSLIDELTEAQLLDVQKHIQGKIASMQSTSTTSLTASEITTKLIDAQFPLSNSIDYTDATDPNTLLGRPNQYTSKTNAVEKRAKNDDKNDPSSFTVEVFENVDDCVAREKYIASFPARQIKQYVYRSANVLLRVSTDLLPSDAEEYGNALQSIVDGTDLVACSYDSSVAENENESNDCAATRESPAYIGDRVEFQLGDDTIAVTVLNAFQGSNANMFVKSFNRYNTSGYRMTKGTEWVLLYLKVECVDAYSGQASLSDFYFHLASLNGVVKNDSYMSDNPMPISNLFTGAVSYCWYGGVVTKDDEVLLVCDSEYDGNDAIWFSTRQRRGFNSNDAAYSSLKKGDSGDAVLKLNYALAELGYFSKVPNNEYNSNTVQAIKKYQKAIGLKATGEADNETQTRLFSANPME